MLAMFGDALVPGARVLGDPPSDMLTHSLPWRAFGFGELAKGNLALWNPHVFGGAPYFGGLQMDIGFQRTYGAGLLARKGTADHWTPLEQMWVAERALRSGRGFFAWPNTARACGVL